MLLSLFLLSNSFVTVIVDRNKTRSNLSKGKTDHYKESQTKEKTKWNQLNQIKENKNSLETIFKSIWDEIKTWK